MLTGFYKRGSARAVFTNRVEVVRVAIFGRDFLFLGFHDHRLFLWLLNRTNFCRSDRVSWTLKGLSHAIRTFRLFSSCPRPFPVQVLLRIVDGKALHHLRGVTLVGCL